MLTEILKIAEANMEGFTIELEYLTFITSGIVVAYEETQNSFGFEGLKKVVNHSLYNEKVIGGWFDSENQKFYFDSCKVFKNLDEAIEFGRLNGQRAIFDLDNLREIRL
jgi:fructokinase